MVERLAHVRAQLVELADGNVLEPFPALALVVRHVQASVVTHEQAFRVDRVRPQRLEVAVEVSGHRIERATAVDREHVGHA